MKTFRFSKRSAKQRGREIWMARVKLMNAARERNRVARVNAEPERAEWRGRHEHAWTFCDRITGTMHTLDIYRGRRRDQYDVTVDGKPWKRGISATVLATYVRRKLTAHIAPE